MKFIGIVVAATALGCGSSTAPKTPSYVGTWDLTTVDGKVLPDTFVQIAGTGDFLLLDSATLVLPQTGTGTLATHFHISVSTTDIADVDTVAALDSGTELEWINRGDTAEPIAVIGDTLVLTTTRFFTPAMVFRFQRASP